MRIISGQYAGRRLRTPPGRLTRPTSDRTREALFASLDATHDITAGPFLDLYAGSGAVGLEALSRGAPHVWFVESARAAVAAIGQNLADLGLTARASVSPLPASAAVDRLAAVRAATVFADPPYELEDEDLATVLRGLLRVDAVHRDALVIVERAARGEWTWPTGLHPDRDRRYGEARLWYGRRL